MTPQPLRTAALKLAISLDASLSDGENAALHDYLDRGGDFAALIYFIDLNDMKRRHLTRLRPISGGGCAAISKRT